MDFITPIYDALQITFSTAGVLFLDGGWVLLVGVAAYISYRMYMNKIVGIFVGSHEQIFLQIKVEKENIQSLLAMEQIFAQMHAIHSNFTWAEQHFEGIVNLWISLEIVSIGGKISFIIKTPKRYKILIESAFYAQFPNAEITEVQDYMAPLEHWTPESSWDLWGTEMGLTKDYAYPIKTWRDFEHPAAENPQLDPTAGILEALGRAEEHELMAVQFILRPIGDAQWQPHCEEVVKKLKGEDEHNSTLGQKLLSPITKIGEKSFLEMLNTPAKHTDAHGNEFPKVQRMSEGEKKVLSAIEMKMSKTAWETKIRLLYIAPKDRFDGNKKSALIGGFRMLSGMTTNNLKPDVSHTWTRQNYIFSKTLEAPYTEYVTEHKKHLFLKGFASRSLWIGQYFNVMNIEELATLFHFPLATTSTPPVERIDVKKGQPPQNLPVAF